MHPLLHSCSSSTYACVRYRTKDKQPLSTPADQHSMQQGIKVKTVNFVITTEATARAFRQSLLPTNRIPAIW